MTTNSTNLWEYLIKSTKRVNEIIEEIKEDSQKNIATKIQYKMIYKILKCLIFSTNSLQAQDRKKRDRQGTDIDLDEEFAEF